MSLKAHNVFMGARAWEVLDQHLEAKAPSKVFILVDSNTHEHCLTPFAQALSNLPEDFEILEVDPGEQSKSLEIVAGLWNVLHELGADRNTTLIGLGGGVVTDLGGFLAATYMRGIDYVAVPTSLLAMVDAAVGGKNGIDFGGVKNLIGTFSLPAVVAVIPDFLDTLPAKEWHSGHGEMIKHALLSSISFEETMALTPESLNEAHIEAHITFKAGVVDGDLYDRGARAQLNLGHTFGHAYEAWRMASEQPVTHGSAVIQGLHVALKLSGLEAEQAALAAHYPWIPVPNEALETLWSLQGSDKKTQDGAHKWVLLEKSGAPTLENAIDVDQWAAALVALGIA